MSTPTKISYRIYYKRKKIEQFEKFWNWPFIWNVGLVIRRGKKAFRITKINEIGYSNQVKIYVRRVKEKAFLSGQAGV